MSADSSTLNEVRAAIYQRFLNEWANLTPHVFDNEQFAGNLDPKGESWVRLSVRNLNSTQETLGKAGGRKYERKAMAFLQIFVPPNTSTKEADQIMQAGMDLFEGRSIPGTSINFNDVVPRELGNIEDGRWWGSTITANFAYYQIK